MSRITLLATLLLASCAQWQADREARERAEAQARADAMATHDDALCKSYGAAPGSQAYVQCRSNLDNQRAQMAAALVPVIAGGGLFRQPAYQMPMPR
jgi:hypothetical protein